MGVTNIFHTVIRDFLKAAKAFKSVVLKAANEAPMVINTLEHNAPEIEALTNLLFPGAGAIEAAALVILEHVASAVEAAGAAASANGLNVALDQSAVQAVQAILPAIKAAAVNTNPTPVPVPTVPVVPVLPVVPVAVASTTVVPIVPLS